MTNDEQFLHKLIEKLYEDEHYIVFNKPSGLLVIATPKNEKNTLVNIVNHQYTSKEGRGYLHPCHRLDRETSGVILFAKGKHNQQIMMEIFKKHDIKKYYIAFVYGMMRKLQGELRSFIRDFDQQKFQKKAPSKLAITRYKVLETKKNYSVVEVQPVTGRTNQIRIQFGQIGHPLVGERKYALARDYALRFRRAALHAHTLELTHPVTHKKMMITSKLPNDMEVFLARNRN